MKLRPKLTLTYILIVLFSISVMVILGTAIIDRIMYQMMQETLKLRLTQIMDRLHDYQDVLEETGLNEIAGFREQAEAEAIQALNNYRFGETGMLFIVDMNIDVVVPLHFTKGSKYDPDFFRRLISEKSGLVESHEHLGSHRFTMYDTFDPWHWLIMISIERTEMYQHKHIYLIRVILIAVMILIMTYFIARTLSRKITSRIYKLLASVNEVSKGNLDVEIETIPCKDEICALQTGIAQMLGQITQETRDRDKAENALKESERRLFDIINFLPDPTFVIDLDHRVIAWNRAMERITGIPAKEILGLSNYEYAVPFYKEKRPILIDLVLRPRDEIRKSYNNSFWQDNTLVAETEVELLNSGKISYMIGSACALYDSAGKLVGAIESIKDITPRKTIEEEKEKLSLQLQRSQKMEAIGTLAGGLAHDFNNVLGGIKGTVSLLKYTMETHGNDKSRFEELLKLIDHASDRAVDMVDQLLMLSKRQKLSLEPVDLNKSLENIIKICNNTFDKSIDINVEYYPKPAMTMADPTQVEQVILNLAVNASHAMTLMRNREDHYGGSFYVSIGKQYLDKYFTYTHPNCHEGEYWIIRVKDTGVGMDAHTMTKIFDPFFTTKDQEFGTGLGMAMVYNIILNHKGFVDVYSELGLGTTFLIYLPVHSSTPIPIKIPIDDAVLSSGSETVLVVDDEEIMRNIGSSMLQECGYKVILASSGIEALEIYRERFKEIDIVLLDMAMPKMSGKETYKEMKKINPDIKVLLASGFRQDQRVEETIELGANEFIQKPYVISDLTHYISKILKS